jgi:dynein heavy chain, axonemal
VKLTAIFRLPWHLNIQNIVFDQVEVWLNRLLDNMRETVRHEMSEAIASAEEKAREAWIFEPPAQVALCSAQIWWTVEVNIAFQRLEEGYENALKDFNKKQVSLPC